MEWGHIEDGGIWVTKGKTKIRLWIPFTDRLREELAATPRRSLRYILCDDHGRKLKYDQIQKATIVERKRLGLDAYSLHGLRYSAASELAEAGCTDHQIAAITGHMSMVQKYSKGASQKRLAKQAQAKRDQNRNRT